MVYVWYGRPAGHLPAGSGYAPCDDGRYPALAGGVQTILDAFWNCLLPGVADAALPAKPCGLCRTDEKVIHHAAADCGKPGGPRHRALLCDGADGPQRPGLTACSCKKTHWCCTTAARPARCLSGRGHWCKAICGRPRAALCYRRLLACSGLPPFRVHLLGERLGSLSLQLKLRPGGATLALCSHEEHPDPDFSGTAEGVTAV